MAGSAQSIQKSEFVGIRVASTNYYPAHNKNGVPVQQRLSINAFMNIKSRANNGEGISAVIRLTAWGKLADSCALSMSPGKEFHCFCEANPYRAKVYNGDQLVLKADGTPLEMDKVSFTIRKMLFGAESAKQIAKEIQIGHRPPNWDREGTADYVTWRETLKARMATAFQPGMAQYGFATVRPVTGPGITAYVATPRTTAPTAPAIAPAAAVENAVVNAAANPAAVAPVMAPVATAVPATGQALFPAGV